MANQPPSRPLFRLPNLGRQAPPPPAPPAAAAQPQPRPSPPQQARPPVIHPAFAQSIRPTQPQARPPQPQLPPTTTTTPPQPPAITPSSTPPLTPPRTATAPTPSPLASPSPPPSRPVATPQPPAALSPPSPASPPRAEFISNQSSKMSPMLSSPSPRKPQVSEELPPPLAAAASSLDSMTLTYPPKSSSYPETMSPKSSAAAQSAKTYTRSSPPISLPPQSKEPKVELKNMMVQAIYSKQPISISTMKEADRRMLSSYSEDDRNVKVLNVGDKTKGVKMEVGVSLTINRGRKHDFVGTANFNGNGNVGNEARESDGSLRKGIGKASRRPIEAFVSSNIQGINSSILLDSSVTHRDPGVHFHLSKKPINGD